MDKFWKSDLRMSALNYMQPLPQAPQAHPLKALWNLDTNDLDFICLRLCLSV